MAGEYSAGFGHSKSFNTVNTEDAQSITEKAICGCAFEILRNNPTYFSPVTP
jgi:hypothetical protein